MYLLIALVLQATAPDAATPAQPPVEAPATAPVAPAQTPPVQTAAATPQTEIRCRWVAPTGQRLRQRVCETVNLLQERAEASEEATRDLTMNRGISQ